VEDPEGAAPVRCRFKRINPGAGEKDNNSSVIVIREIFFAGFCLQKGKPIEFEKNPGKRRLRMKSSKMIVAASLMTVLLMASVLYAGEGMGSGFGAGRGWGLWGDLSKEQQKQFTDVRLEFMKKQAAVESEMIKRRVELAELNAQEKPDEQGIQKKRQEIWALQDKLRDEQRAVSDKLRGILTPEQRAKIGPAGPGAGCCMRGGRGGRGMMGGGGPGAGALCPACPGGPASL
jgi:Spy/CpxP family protein refolding chaperone